MYRKRKSNQLTKYSIHKFKSQLKYLIDYEPLIRHKSIKLHIGGFSSVFPHQKAAEKGRPGSFFVFKQIVFDKVQQGLTAPADIQGRLFPCSGGSGFLLWPGPGKPWGEAGSHPPRCGFRHGPRFPYPPEQLQPVPWGKISGSCSAPEA